MTLRLATWNINSVRLRIDQVARFVAERAPDVLLLQEIKCTTDQFPRAAFEEMGLPHLRVRGQKGWHGVAIASRLPIEDNDTLEVCKLGHARCVSGRIAGVDEVWRVGGAQAIAAMAYGTQTMQAVDKITGPGNAYVAAAKRQVFGRVGIDSIAGPSEVLVIAQGAQNPEWLALDLLAQAEHDADAQAILMTPDPALAMAVVAAVHRILPTLPRAAIAGAS